ncbi:hypothetical protein ACFE04_013684 [Oxalis oulophora]
MEETKAVEKHSPSHDHDCHLGSKSGGTVIQIDSISIDLVNANDVWDSGKSEVGNINCNESAAEGVNEDASPNKSAGLSDTSGGYSRKRTRKMRSLTDLFAENGDANTDVVREENSAQISDSFASAEVSAHSGARFSSQEDLAYVARNNRRKLTPDDECRPPQMCSTSNAPKVTSCGSKEGFKASSNDNSIKKSPVTGKKQMKTSKILHKSSSVELSSENMGGDIREEVGVGHIDKGKSLLNLPALKRNRISSKNKNKMHQNDETASLNCWKNNLPSESPISARDKCNMQNEQIAIPLHSTQNAHPSKGLNHSLNTSMALQRCDIEPGPQITEEGLIKRKDLNMSFSNPGSSATLEKEKELQSYFKRAFSCVFNNKKTSNKNHSLNVKRKKVSQIEGGHYMDSTETSNKENQENSAPSTKFSDQGAENAEFMGIVELMAKNQYDRCRPDADSDKQRANNTQGAHIIDLNEAYIGGDNSDREEIQNKGENSNIRIGENVGPTKEKTFDYLSSIDRSHSGQTDTSSGLGPFPQPSSGVQCFPTSINRPVNSQKNQWTGYFVGKSPSHSGFPAGGAYNNLDGNNPLQGEAVNHSWPSLYPSNGPFIHNIARKQADQGSHKNVLSHYPSKDSLSGNHLNDARSAMHLLGLMDPNLPTTNGTKSPLQSPPFTCHNSNGFSGLPSTNDNSSIIYISQNSDQHFPTVGAPPFPFENRKILNNGSNTPKQVSVKSRGRGKSKVHNPLTQKKGSSSQNAVLARGSAGTACRLLPEQGMQKIPPSISNYMLNTQQFPAQRDPYRQKLEKCALNRNPADFSIPEAGNDYMIAGEDLKFDYLMLQITELD